MGLRRSLMQVKRTPWAQQPKRGTVERAVLALVRQHPLEGLTSTQLWEGSELAREDVYKRLPRLFREGWVRRTCEKPYQYYCTQEEEVRLKALEGSDDATPT